VKVEGIVRNGEIVFDVGDRWPEGTPVQMTIDEVALPSSDAASPQGQRWVKFAGGAGGPAAPPDHIVDKEADR
jgi:hypothetical protein